MAVKDAAAELYERLLILRCQAGDDAALGELIAGYSPGLRFFLAKMIGSPEAADDLMQETWIDVYRNINRLKNAGAFAAWLYRIARDKAHRELRRRPPIILSVDDDIAEPTAAAKKASHPKKPRLCGRRWINCRWSCARSCCSDSFRR